MSFLIEQCTFFELTEDVLATCQPFSCGNADLDDFFQPLRRYPGVLIGRLGVSSEFAGKGFTYTMGKKISAAKIQLFFEIWNNIKNYLLLPKDIVTKLDELDDEEEDVFPLAN